MGGEPKRKENQKGYSEKKGKKKKKKSLSFSRGKFHDKEGGGDKNGIEKNLWKKKGSIPMGKKAQEFSWEVYLVLGRVTAGRQVRASLKRKRERSRNVAKGKKVL